MSMTDPVADMLTRIRNGQQARLSVVKSPYSSLRVGILEALKKEGYIRGYSKAVNDNNMPELKIELKYLNGEAVIKEIKRMSTPGKRQYSNISDLPKYYNGLGITILSTSKGVMSDYDARVQNVGGEVLCCVF